MTIIQTIGIGMILLVLVFNGIARAKKWFKTKGQIAYAICISLFAFVAGVVLVFNERVTEMSVKGFGAGGTVKAALKGAQSDAKEIADIKERVLSYRATIDAAFSTASLAHQLGKVATQTVAEAKQALQEMKSDAKFIRTLERAKIGFADSWDELKRISVDDADPRHEEAFNAITAVMDQYDDYGYVTRKPGRVPFPNPASVTLKEIEEAFRRMHLFQQVESIFFIHEQQRFSEAEKLAFFYQRAMGDPNLRVRAAAGRCYLDRVGIKEVNPLSWNIISNNWATNPIRLLK